MGTGSPEGEGRRERAARDVERYYGLRSQRLLSGGGSFFGGLGVHDGIVCPVARDFDSTESAQARSLGSTACHRERTAGMVGAAAGRIEGARHFSDNRDRPPIVLVVGLGASLSAA